MSSRVIQASVVLLFFGGGTLAFVNCSAGKIARIEMTRLDDAGIEQLVSWLADEREGVRPRIVYRISQRADIAIPYMLRATRTDDLDLADGIAEAFCRLPGNPAALHSKEVDVFLRRTMSKNTKAQGKACLAHWRIFKSSDAIAESLRDIFDRQRIDYFGYLCLLEMGRSRKPYIEQVREKVRIGHYDTNSIMLSNDLLDCDDE